MFLEYDPRRAANFLRDCKARTTLGVILKPPLSFSAAIVIGTVLAFVDAVVRGGLNERYLISRLSLPIHLKRTTQAIAMGRFKNVHHELTFFLGSTLRQSDRPKFLGFLWRRN